MLISGIISRKGKLFFFNFLIIQKRNIPVGTQEILICKKGKKLGDIFLRNSEMSEEAATGLLFKSKY